MRRVAYSGVVPRSTPAPLSADAIDVLAVLSHAGRLLGAARDTGAVEGALRAALVPQLVSACDLRLGSAAGENSSVQFPLSVRGRTLGTLSVTPDPTLDGPQLRSLLALVADRAALELQALGAGAVGAADSALERAVEARTLQFFQASSELAARNRALEAFASLTREFATETSFLRLVTRAQETLLALLPEGVSAYLEPEGAQWQVRQLVGNLRNEALRDALAHGFPRGPLAAFEEAFQHGTASFEHVVPPEVQAAFPHLFAQIGALAVLPLRVQGETRGVLAVALFRQRVWLTADRALLTTAVRQLQVALERSEALTKVAEQHVQLQARSEELAELNRELEAFSYSVSHDLQAPLRHIMGFADLARRAQPDAPGTPYLNRITHSAERMSALIELLLAHARLGRQPLQRRPVSLAALVWDVQQELAPDAEGRCVRWVVGDLPVVRGDPALLRLAVQNLLSNALKYTRGRAEAVVKVTADVQGDEVVLVVRDNGAGFNPKYAARLFTAFGRLHKQEDFEGNGVGLANVRRIVARHGGRVWAEGQPGGGAAFFVALPRT